MAKPTPTQEENDRAAMGEHVVEKEPDGSPEDPNATPPDAHGRRRDKEGEGKSGNQPMSTRSMEAGKPQSYATRSGRPETKTGSND
jgi:hypothetical protein